MMKMTIAALAHIGRHHPRQPQIAEDIVDHHPLEHFVGQLFERAVMRVDRGVADEDVDAAPCLARLGDEILQLRLVGDPRGDGDRFATLGADRRRHLLAGCGVAGRDHHPPAGFGKRLGDRAADAAARAGNNRDFAGQVEELHDAFPQHCMAAFRSCGIVRLFGRGSGLAAEQPSMTGSTSRHRQKVVL
jgi:hypothetical protein